MQHSIAPAMGTTYRQVARDDAKSFSGQETIPATFSPPLRSANKTTFLLHQYMKELEQAATAVLEHVSKGPGSRVDNVTLRFIENVREIACWGGDAAVGRYVRDFEAYAGKKIEVPTSFISGKQDWGIYQEFGALRKMEDGTVGNDFRELRLVDGVGHWAPPKCPDELMDVILGLVKGL